jgi:phage gpG-like protein
MFALEVGGLDETRRRIDAYPAALQAALDSKAAELAAALADLVKSDKLSGGALNTRSGALGDSIAASVTADADRVLASVSSEGDVKYAAIQEYGGKTGAHEILPVKARALAFVVDGAEHFARRVEHPGSLIPERSYLRSALDDMKDEIVDALAGAAGEAWEGA